MITYELGTITVEEPIECCCYCPFMASDNYNFDMDGWPSMTDHSCVLLQELLCTRDDSMHNDEECDKILMKKHEKCPLKPKG